MIYVAIYIVLALIGLGLLLMLVSGLRTLMFGKASPLSIGIMAVPFVMFAILRPILGSWPEAGIMTILISILLTMLALLASGVRGLFM